MSDDFGVQIEMLEAEVTRLSNDLRNARKELVSAKAKSFSRESGISVGSVVVKDGVLFKVTEVCPDGMKGWLWTVQQKKDGSWGDKKRVLFGGYSIHQQD